jgi:hypothetical protein
MSGTENIIEEISSQIMNLIIEEHPHIADLNEQHQDMTHAAYIRLATYKLRVKRFKERVAQMA